MKFSDAMLSLVVPSARRIMRAAEAQGIDIKSPPPRRPYVGEVTDRDSLAITAVFRTVQVITTAAAQVSLEAERQNLVTDRPHPLIRRPDVDMSRSAWIGAAVMSMVYTGNTFLLLEPGPNLKVLNPHAVRIDQHPKTGRITYWHNGTEYSTEQVKHCTFLPPLPGQLYGLGPIQAAQSGMRTKHDMDEHMSRWFHDTGQPRGVLTSTQKLTAEQARRHRNAWNGLDEDGNPLPVTANPSGIKVLDADTSYESILLSPRDALWLEAQDFTTRDLAMLFGIPSTLMLVSLEGSSQTYANVEQEWLSFTRFTLMGYLRPLEDALTEVLPNGQVARFNLESLLRADTTTRYQGHQSALDAGWMTPDEVRAIEGLPPLTPAQQEQIAARNPSTSTTPQEVTP